MSYWMTQSLLNSWLYFLNADDAYADTARDSFLATLRRQPQEPSKAMLDGIRFEDLVNRLVAHETVDTAAEGIDAKWLQAAMKIAHKCAGGVSQAPVCGTLHTAGMDFVLYGICDYVKAGVIIDIKKPTRYEYGKYFDSPQHPMYLHLLPEAKRFDYLIFDGTYVHRETYRRGDYEPIENKIHKFINWLGDMGLLDEYKRHWAMNDERMEKTHGFQI